MHLSKLYRYFRDPVGNEAVDDAFKRMLPGMLVEQAAAVLLANVNIFVTGFISTEALAGVGQISTVNSILMNAFQAFSIGGTAVAARYIGAKQNKQASAAAASGLLLGGLFSGLVTLLIFLLRVPLINLLFGRAEAAVLENSMTYFSFTALAPVMWFFYFQCCGFMRSAGDTRTPMIVSVVLNSLSILLNLLFTLVLGMGVKGSAIAYLTSVSVAALLAIGLLLRRTSAIRPQMDGSALKSCASAISSIAVPSMAENLAFNGSRIVLQVFLAGMGTAMISANQVFVSVNDILLVPFMSMYYLTIPLVGMCYGVEDEQGVRRCIRHLCRRALGWASVTGIAHLLLAAPLCLLFSRDTVVLKIAIGMSLIFGVVSPLQSRCFVLPNCLKAVGDARFPMLFSSCTAWGIRVLGTWILGVLCGWGAYGMIVTQGLDYVARSVAYSLRFNGDKWTRKLDRAEPGSSRM